MQSFLLKSLVASLALFLIAGLEIKRNEPQTLFRPIDVQIDSENDRIYVVQKNGNLTAIQRKNGAILWTKNIQKQLTHSCWLGDGILILTGSGDVSTGGELIAVNTFGPNEPEDLWRMKTVNDPVRVEVSWDHRTLAIAGRWSRSVRIVTMAKNGWRDPPVVRSNHELDFSPKYLAWLDDRRLVVADAFGGRFTILDVGSELPEKTYQLADRRIGGMYFEKEKGVLWFTVQLLNPLARSDRNDIHWGLLMSNQIVGIRPEQIKDEKVVSRFDFQYPIGGPDDGKGDPGELQIDAKGQFVVCLEGVQELAIGNPAELGFAYVKVGNRPVAVALDNLTSLAYVANELDNEVSTVGLDDFRARKPIVLGEAPEISQQVLGERLFFDANVSHDGWLSCHSCHVEGHSNGLLNDNLSDGSYGTPKRVISLLGVHGTEPLAWNGEVVSMEKQVEASINITMQSDSPAKAEQVVAIAEYLKRLPPPPKMVFSEIAQEFVTNGEKLFAQLHCGTCHVPPNMTSPDRYDVGLKDERGQSKFNPPSLRGVAYRNELFHDSHALSLEKAFGEGKHGLSRELSDVEIKQLVAFLRSL